MVGEVIRKVVLGTSVGTGLGVVVYVAGFIDKYCSHIYLGYIYGKG